MTDVMNLLDLWFDLIKRQSDETLRNYHGYRDVGFPSGAKPEWTVEEVALWAWGTCDIVELVIDMRAWGVCYMTWTPDYNLWMGRIRRQSYGDLRRWRDRITRDLENCWVYRHRSTNRTQSGDRLLVAWLNAEIVRRLWGRAPITGD